MKEDKDFYFWHIGFALSVFVLALAAIEVFDLDRRLSGLFYDPHLGRFPLRDMWLLEKVQHSATRNAVIVLALAVLCFWIALPGIQSHKRFRPALLFVFAAMALSSLIVVGIRNASDTYCPYDLQEFGGANASVGSTTAQYQKPGKCRPSAHASVGFCLFAWYFAVRSLGRRRLAGYVLGGVIVFGVVLSAGRIVQGAHFLSHCIWSAIICWFVTVGLYRWMLVRPPSQRVQDKEA